MRNALARIGSGIKDYMQSIVSAIDLRDVFAFGGLAMVGYGLGEVFPPVAWLVCGCALFWLGVKK